MTYRLKALSAETTKFIEEKQALEARLTKVTSDKETADAELQTAQTNIDTLKQAQLQVS
jgi:hypothetical protein